MSGPALLVLAPLLAVGVVVGFALAMLTPRTWRATRPRPARLPTAELVVRARERLAREVAEVLPAHPLGWELRREGGVVAAYGPGGERHVYSVASCGWVRA